MNFIRYCSCRKSVKDELKTLKVRRIYSHVILSRLGWNLVWVFLCVFKTGMNFYMPWFYCLVAEIIAGALVSFVSNKFITLWINVRMWGVPS